jgi:hypothetical protein
MRKLLAAVALLVLFATRADATYTYSPNVKVAGGSDVLLADTGQHNVISYTTPAVQASYEISLSFRVITAPTTFTATLSWTDGTGAQSMTWTSASNYPVNAYALPPMTINVAASTTITLATTAGTASQVYVSATLVTR